MKVLSVCVLLLYQHHHVLSAGLFANLSNFFRNIKEDLHRLFEPVRPDVTSVTIYTGETFKVVDDMSAQSISEHEHLSNYSDMDFDSTAVLAADKLVKLHRHYVEIHKVITEDGYHLTMHRVIPKSGTIPNNRSVLLHHGFLGSSADWVMLGPKKSLPYLLSNAGYDVWMTNARGNHYSSGHESLSNNSIEYWKFTWQEMGYYDLRAVIDYIRLRKMNNKPINFIGHSMGASALLVLLSMFPAYNAHLRIAILLAPLAFMNEVRGPLQAFAALSSTSPDTVLYILGQGQIFPRKRMPPIFVKKFCTISSLFCSNPLFFFCGSMKTALKNRDEDFLSKILYHVPAGGSSHTLLHYAQLLKSGKFHYYNNIEKEFDLKKVSLPIALFSSTDDTFAPVSDVTKLYVTIRNPVEHVIIKNKSITHTEFVWGTYARKKVFRKVMSILDYDLANATRRNEIR